MENRISLTSWLRILIPILLVITIISSIYVSVQGATTYQDYEGNITGLKPIDPPIDYTVYFNDDGTVSESPTERYVKFDVSDDKLSLSFQATGVTVKQVYLKGGDGYRVYSFDPGVSEASGLVCPNNGGSNVPMISHFGPVEVGMPTETTATTSATTAATTATTTTTSSSETTATTTGQSETTTNVTTAVTTSTASTSSSTPTETIPEDLPKTGENSGYAMMVTGIMLLILGAALLVWRRRLKKRGIIH